MPRPAKYRLLVLDVDGVMTDGRLYYGPRGEELKVFHVHDGVGIRALQRAGFVVAVISGRRTSALRVRCRDLGIRHVHLGVEHKLPVFESLCRKLGIPASQCVVVGDDLPDVPLMRVAGLSFSVPGAQPAARRAARYRTRARGGEGAVREICDRLLRQAPR